MPPMIDKENIGKIYIFTRKYKLFILYTVMIIEIIKIICKEGVMLSWY